MSSAAAENRDSHRDSASFTIDWRKRAQDAWSDPGWGEAAADYHRSRGKRTLVVEIEPERLARLRRLIANDISLDRACAELNDPRGRPAPQATIDALVYELRTHGLTALEHPSCLRRLSAVSTVQLRDVIARLIRLRPKYPAVTDDLLLKLGEQL
jgi:hypothetical protein